MRAFSGNGQQAIPRADPRRTLEPAAVQGGCRLQSHAGSGGHPLIQGVGPSIVCLRGNSLY
jgi:hypothetical protein